MHQSISLRRSHTRQRQTPTALVFQKGVKVHQSGLVGGKRFNEFHVFAETTLIQKLGIPKQGTIMSEHVSSPMRRSSSRDPKYPHKES